MHKGLGVWLSDIAPALHIGSDTGAAKNEMMMMMVMMMIKSIYLQNKYKFTK